MTHSEKNEVQDMTMNEAWARIKVMAAKVWARAPRRVRIALVLVACLYVSISRICQA